ncbi:hypothetical protein DMH26_00170 [Streptomyces sp. WAC 05379]|nr:hypothetical protein DMH26_00170 [Streptomyces sp. WAC 05379]
MHRLRWWPVRFTERRVLAEEHHWRAWQPGAVRGWNVAVLGAGRAGPLHPVQHAGSQHRLDVLRPWPGSLWHPLQR